MKWFGAFRLGFRSQNEKSHGKEHAGIIEGVKLLKGFLVLEGELGRGI